MSPLIRYYGAWLLNLGAFAAFVVVKAPFLIIVWVISLLLIKFVHCPACGERLARNRRKWIHLFPATSCLKCGHDLTT